MAWSRFTEINGAGRSDYAVTIARSSNGQLDGTWIQETEPFYASHGGHGMIFEDFEGQLRLGLHQPNSGGPSPTVPSFIPIYDVGSSVTFTEPNQSVSTVGYFRFEEGAPSREFVDGVDIIDVSGQENHLRTFLDDTAGNFHDSMTGPTINQTGRRNLLSYDNSPAPAAPLLLAIYLFRRVRSTVPIILRGLSKFRSISASKSPGIITLLSDAMEMVKELMANWRHSISKSCLTTESR